MKRKLESQFQREATYPELKKKIQLKEEEKGNLIFREQSEKEVLRNEFVLKVKIENKKFSIYDFRIL